MEHIRTILKPLFEMLTGEIKVSENVLLNFIFILIIGELAYRIAYHVVRKGYFSGVINGKREGSLLHWAMRLLIYFLLACFFKCIIAIYDFFKSIPNMITNTTEEFLTMMDLLSDNLNWILPLLITVVFSIINIVMARKNSDMVKNQIKLQNDAFCYDLLEKRMEIYLSVKETLSKVSRDGNISFDDVAEFMKTHQKACFLFGDDIDKKLESIGLLLVELRELSRKIEREIQTQDESSEHNEICDKHGELIIELSNIFSNLKDDFKPYISFRNYRIEAEEVKNERSRKK